MSDNPYQSQTDANTKTDWLDGGQVVDVDLDGMVEFAKHMVGIKEYLEGHTGYLELLASLPGQAWEQGVLPEGAYAMQKMLTNYTELRQYLLYLGITLDNIGMASQTIADIYSETDGWSSADLNAVNFVFGESGAHRPAGLPPWFPVTTFWDEYFKQQEKAAQSPSTTGVKWTAQPEVRNPDGSVVNRSVAPDGRVMEIKTFDIPGGGGSVTTTTLYSPDGAVLSRSSERGNTFLGRDNSVQTTSTTYDADGNTTGSKEKSVTYGENGQVTGESTVNKDKDGVPTTRVETVTNPDGSQTTTTYRGDTILRQVQTGAQTAGVTGVVESEAKNAMDRVENKYSEA